MARIAASLLAIMLAAPALAQDLRSADTLARPACELHVWPSAGLAVMRAHAHDNFVWSAGDGQRGIVGLVSHSAAASGPNVNDTFTTEHYGPLQNGPLTPSRQIALMQALPLAEMLGLPGYRPVFHSGSKTLADVRKPARLSEDGPACHAELLLTDLTYARVYAHGHNLKAFWVLRDFGSDLALKRRAGLPEENPLTVPTDETKRTDDAFFADLERAFTSTLQQFGRDVQQKAKP